MRPRTLPPGLSWLSGAAGGLTWLAVSCSGGRTITVAGERFHMVQNVSMAVHHIGREPTVRGQGAKAGGEQPVALIDQASLCCISPISASLSLSVS